MKYAVTLGITLPAYADVEIEATSDEEAIEKAKDMAEKDFNIQYDPSFEWSEESRVVSVTRPGEDGAREYVAENIVVCPSHYQMLIAELEQQRDRLLDQAKARHQPGEEIIAV